MNGRRKVLSVVALIGAAIFSLPSIGRSQPAPPPLPYSFVMSTTNTTSPWFPLSNGLGTCSVVVDNVPSGLTIIPQVTSDTLPNQNPAVVTASNVGSGAITAAGTSVGNVSATGLTGFRLVSSGTYTGTASMRFFCSNASSSGSSGGGSSNVNVQNTPGVTVQNTPSVNVANTPGVNVANTPGVVVANSSANPVPVAAATGTYTVAIASPVPVYPAVNPAGTAAPQNLDASGNLKVNVVSGGGSVTFPYSLATPAAQSGATASGVGVLGLFATTPSLTSGQVYPLTMLSNGALINAGAVCQLVTSTCANVVNANSDAGSANGSLQVIGYNYGFNGTTWSRNYNVTGIASGYTNHLQAVGICDGTAAYCATVNSSGQLVTLANQAYGATTGQTTSANSFVGAGGVNASSQFSPLQLDSNNALIISPTNLPTPYPLPTTTAAAASNSAAVSVRKILTGGAPLTTTVLGNGATFTSPWFDSTLDDASYVEATYLDAATTSPSLFEIQETPDTSLSAQYNVATAPVNSNGSIVRLVAPITSRYWRVVFTAGNGQTSLEINAIETTGAPPYPPAAVAGQVPYTQITNPSGSTQANVSEFNADANSNTATGLQTMGYNASFNGATWDRNLTCDGTPTAINITTATTTQIVALSGTTKIHVCSYQFSVAGTTPTVTFEYGTGTTCATGLTAISGAIAPTTGSVINSPAGGGSNLAFVVPAGDALCILSGGTTPSIQGWITYAQY